MTFLPRYRDMRAVVRDVLVTRKEKRKGPHRLNVITRNKSLLAITIALVLRSPIPDPDCFLERFCGPSSKKFRHRVFVDPQTPASVKIYKAARALVKESGCKTVRKGHNN